MRGKIVFSFASSILLLITSYYVGNSAFPLSSSETAILKLYERCVQPFKHYSHDDNNKWIDSFLLVNTSRDIVLSGFPCDEKEEIVRETRADRRTLYLFLKRMAKLNNYKYILLDVQLDSLDGKCVSSEYDSFDATVYSDSLATIISSLERIVVAKSELFQFFSESLEKKAGSVDYYDLQLDKNFVKYSLSNNTGISLPYRMYSELSNRTISHWGNLLFWDGKRLCNRSLIPSYEIRELLDTEVDDNNDKHYLDYINLGSNGLDELYDDESFSDKIVVIGNFMQDDMHGTYVGRMPGVLINVNSYISLTKGLHIINYWSILFLLIAYFIVSLKICHHCESHKLQQENMPMAKWKGLLSLFSWTTIFYVVSLIVYICIEKIYNPWWPAIWFSILPTIYMLIFGDKKNV